MRLAVLCLVGACWTSSQPVALAPAPTPITPGTITFRAQSPRSACQRSILAMLDKLRPDLARTGIPEAAIDEMQGAAIDSCQELEWSSELIACYDRAADTNDLNACQNLMTPEQTEDITRRMMDIVSRMNTTVAPPPPP